MALADVTVQTALLEARFLCGARKVFNAFTRATGKAMDAKAFLRAKTLEMQQRHQKYENTPYALEPNCKESPGGLRDLQTVIWVARAAGFGRTWKELAAQGLITPFEMRQLQRNEGILKLVRARLHAVAGRREDRLVFDLQTAVAESFGYRSLDGQRASERLMRRYYWAAKAVTQLNQILMLNIEERITGQQDAPMRPITEKFLERGGMLEVASDDLYERDPHAILETFLVYQQTVGPKGLSARTLRALYNARHLMDAKFRRDPKNHETFMQILKWSAGGQTHAFRLLNETSVLGRYLWVFRRIVGQMQHDLFHVYTVDQHILMVLRNVRRFLIPEHAHEYPFCSQLASTFDRPWVLYIAALFHDIAKGRGGDHSEVGMRDARRFCRDHGVEREDAALIEWLVVEHLTMSRIAQKEDLSDPEVIDDFAAKVGSERRLTALYLLTVADVRGTSPKVWNAWKGKLLEDLYRLTLRALGGARPNLDAEIEATKLEARLLLNLAMLPGNVELPLWRTLQISYFARHDASEIAWHTRSLIDLVDSPKPVVRARVSPLGVGLQVLVYAPDKRDLFARTCGYFDSASFNILDAKVHTTANGYALDTFLVVSPLSRAARARPDLLRRDAARARARGDRAVARAEPRPPLAPRALLPGHAARDAAPRRARAAVAARRLGERSLGPAVRDLARPRAPRHQPAAGQDHDARRARRGHVPDRRQRAAAEQDAAADRERDARRDRLNGTRVVILTISAAEAIAGLDRFDTIVDARSPSEYAEDRLPGAVNWPSLDDDERALVGTEYKQVSPFAARKRGAALVARNVAAHIERHVLDKPHGWTPLVYCWRGGKRSGALATVLDQIGFRVHVLEGGYRAFRRALVEALAELPARFAWRVVCGPTGVGQEPTARRARRARRAGARSRGAREPSRLRPRPRSRHAPADAEGVRHPGLGRAAAARPRPAGVRRERKQEDRRAARSRSADRAHACIAVPVARAADRGARRAAARRVRLLRRRRRRVLLTARRAARAARQRGCRRVAGRRATRPDRRSRPRSSREALRPDLPRVDAAQLRRRRCAGAHAALGRQRCRPRRGGRARLGTELDRALKRKRPRIAPRPSSTRSFGLRQAGGAAR